MREEEELLQMLLRDPGTELCWDESEPVPSSAKRPVRVSHRGPRQRSENEREEG